MSLDSPGGTETNPQPNQQDYLSRRNFLKLAAATGGVFIGDELLKRFFGQSSNDLVKPISAKFTPTTTPTIPLPDIPTPAPVEREFHPELFHDIPVYGLREPIKSQEDVFQVYDECLTNLLAKKGVSREEWAKISKNQIYIEQRKFLLSPDTRYLEVVMSRSVYESYKNRKNFSLKVVEGDKKEGDCDPVERVLMHVDLMNRALEQAKPPVTLRAQLSRIIVLDDAYANEVWIKDANPKSPDMAWLDHINNNPNLPRDVDTSWAMFDDYRDNTELGFLWTFLPRGDGSIDVVPISENNRNNRLDRPGLHGFIFPHHYDSFCNREDGIILDLGLFEEWAHRLFGLPDEYIYEIWNPNYPNLRLTTGCLSQPNFSPFLAELLNYIDKTKTRGQLGENPPEFTTSIPREIKLHLNLNSTSVEIRGSKTPYKTPDDPQHDYYGDRLIFDTPDQITSGNEVVMGPELLNETTESGMTYLPSLTWMIKINSQNGEIRQLPLPRMAFIMSKLAGIDGTAKYEINFTGIPFTSDTYLLDIVDGSDLHDHLARLNNTITQQAKVIMKVTGTNTYFVWR